ncbi:MAG: hypothetical protein HQM10_23355 [Candidatus Riflebacteria bacterium]|nr:hypothetical protein [Candidatus Riflebacteria bacterium]
MNTFGFCLKKHRGMILAFCVWFLLAPIAESFAEDVGEKKVSPQKYIEAMLKLSGTLNSAGEYDEKMVAARAWAEWANMVSAVYSVIDDECEVPLSLYSSLSTFKSSIEALKEFESSISDALSNTIHGLKIFKKASLKIARFSRNQNYFRNTFHSIAIRSRWLSQKINAVQNTTIGKALETISKIELPEGEEARAWFEWLKSNQGMDAAKLAQTLGVGMAFLDFGLQLADDKWDGAVTWKNVDKAANIAIASVAIVGFVVACFCPPLGAGITAVASWSGTVHEGLKGVQEKLMASRLKWREGFKRSIDFLTITDPLYRTFCEDYKAGKLSEAAKSSSLIYVETECSKMKDEEGSSAKAYEKMLNQAILMSYYSSSDAGLPPREKMWELFAKKADYMKYIPQDPSQKPEESWYEIAMGLMTGTTPFQDAGNTIIEEKVALPWFNPDYVIYKTFRESAKKLSVAKGLSDLLTRRIEQSPFHYIPIICYSFESLTSEFFAESFAADCLMVAQIETLGLAKLVENSVNKLTKMMDEAETSFHKTSDKSFDSKGKSIEALKKMLDLYDQADKQGSLDAVSNFGKNLINIIVMRSAEIKKYTGFSPDDVKSMGNVSLQDVMKNEEWKKCVEAILYKAGNDKGEKAVETIKLLDQVKTFLDLSAIMKMVAKDRKEGQNLESKIKDEILKKFLTEYTADLHEQTIRGEWLSQHLNGYYLSLGTVLDWFSGVEPPIKSLTISATAIEDFSKKMEKRSESFISLLKKRLEELSNESSSDKEFIGKVMAAYEKIGSPIEMDIDSDDKEDSKDIFKYPGELKAIDPEKELDITALESSIGGDSLDKEFKLLTSGAE